MSEALHRDLGMTDIEYAEVVATLGRPPVDPELAMYSVMWSEHCSYKSSRPHLGTLPNSAPWVVIGPGQNAGVIDIGDGWLVAVRIESHNHPTFVEPYQGAGTGVGGILRDVFTMGARPIALWDQIRVGPLEDAHSRYLFEGIVAGIAGYGNAVGVPTVGGELDFDDCYRANPLVNVMALGLLRREELTLAEAGAPGTEVILLGAATGRDGIGGASVLASSGFGPAAHRKRPSVQVGDPFEEKKLIEACLELYRRGLVTGVQDLGAGGLCCASAEPAARSGVGIHIDLDAVHVREPDMSPSELIISESQERMLAFVPPANVPDVVAVAEKWEIDASPIGAVTDGSAVTLTHRGQLVAEAPARSLAHGCPSPYRPARRPAWLDDLQSNFPDLRPPVLETAVRALLDHPAVADPSWVYQQYDHQLFLNTVVEPGHDGSLLRIKGTSKGIAVSTDGNGRLCQLDPRVGAARVVYEAALNVAVVGAEPRALVDNLNFGNPEDPEVMWQFLESIAGIAGACEALGLPVVGGNVSFYNETDGVGIFPTPVVGVLGVADPIPARPPRLDLATAGQEIWLLGPEAQDLAGSLFDGVVRNHLGGLPRPPVPEVGRAAVGLAVEIVGADIASVVHDVSSGGLAVALGEICLKSDVGAVVAYADWRELFSEAPHRFLVVPREGSAGVSAMARARGFPARRIGHFVGRDLVFIGGDAGDARLGLDQVRRIWEEAIPRRLRQGR